MENPEKLATFGTHDEEKQNKNTTQCVLDTTHMPCDKISLSRYSINHVLIKMRLAKRTYIFRA
jgi:hypothetical protein